VTKPVFVVAEAGVNHNGDPELGHQLVDAAAEAGADAVKFQTFTADELVSRGAPKAAYQERTTGTSESQYAMIHRLELSEQMHVHLMEHAKKRGIRFLSTPFGSSSLRLLCERLGLDLIKVGSGELTNLPFLVEVGRLARRVILSTGIGTIGEVEQALAALAWGFTADATSPPSHDELWRAFSGERAQDALRERVTLLHCTTEYPAPFEDVNLRAMDTLRRAFGLPVGYSDHTLGIHVAVAAVARGASVLEKHLTLDRTLPGPDHEASLEPHEFASMVEQVHSIEQALGDGVKRPRASELSNLAVARKSLVAAVPIAKDEPFTEANLTMKRPGNGLPPSMYWSLLGRRSTRQYDADELIR
jgi:N-acetylneuraminate synthase